MDAITMTMMSNGMLAPAGYMLNGFNSYMNGLKLSNTSKLGNAALNLGQGVVNTGASLVGVESVSSKITLALPSPKGSNPWLEGAEIISILAPDDCYINMARSYEQSWIGNWGTFESIPSLEFARNKLAITPEFKKSIDYVQRYKIPKGTRIQVGIVGPQHSNGVFYPGGATQVQILENPKMLQPVDKPIPLK